MLFQILARLSEKFGSVLKMPPLYRWYYAAEFFAGIAALAHLTQATVVLSQPEVDSVQSVGLFQPNSLGFTLLFHHVPLTISVTIGLIITWKYWGWLVTDRKK